MPQRLEACVFVRQPLDIVGVVRKLLRQVIAEFGHDI